MINDSSAAKVHHPSEQRIVLAYSGGLDTSVMLHWLRFQKGYQVLCYCADVGQADELEGLKAKACGCGAADFFVDDLRDEFVSESVFTALKANAVYEGAYLLGTSLARPVIAKGQVAYARRQRALALAHGATGKGNDQVRFELTYQALAPEMKVIAPWRDWEFRSRSDLISYAREHRIPVPATLEKPYSTDRNLMHISYEGGILEDPWQAPPEDLFLLTRSPEQAPDRPVILTIAFDKGIPVSIDGQDFGPRALLEALNAVAGEHAVGRVDIVENRFVGIKSRGVYETPGVTLLQQAHRALESITLDREVLHLRDSLIPRIARLIYNGFWFSPEFKLLRGLVEESQERVTGEVRLKLYKGASQILGRRSPLSLYSPQLATFEEDSSYDPSDATGFIRLQGLRLRALALRKQRWSAQQEAPCDSTP